MQKHYFGVLKPKVGLIQVDQQDIANLDLSLKKFLTNQDYSANVILLSCYFVL